MDAAERTEEVVVDGLLGTCVLVDWVCFDLATVVLVDVGVVADASEVTAAAGWGVFPVST